MVILGIVLLVLGYFLSLYILEVIGVLLIVVGLVLWFVPLGGHTRRYY